MKFASPLGGLQLAGVPKTAANSVTLVAGNFACNNSSLYRKQTGWNTPQALNSQRKFKRITANQNWLLVSWPDWKRLSQDTNLKLPQWQRHQNVNRSHKTSSRNHIRLITTRKQWRNRRGIPNYRQAPEGSASIWNQRINMWSNKQ